MSENRQPIQEEQLKALLQRVGKRESPSPEVADGVRANVHAVWLEEVQRHRTRLRRLVSVAATLVVGLSVGIYVSVQNPAPADLATVVQVVNQPQFTNEDGQWVSAVAGNRLGEAIIKTGANGMMAIQMDAGGEFRIDADSEVSMGSNGQLEVLQGAIYVETDSALPSSVVVSTRYGIARDIGTRFEVRVLPQAWRVQVRDGAVEMRDGDQTSRVAVGERTLISATDEVEVTAVPLSDESWRWVESVAPTFKIEGASLSAYLAWVSRETGQTLRYASPEVEESAKRTILHGSIDGLKPGDSLHAVLATTDLQRVADGSDTLMIDK